MGWTSKPSAVCWGTTMQALPCEPTPTPQGRSRMKLHKRWAASWRRSCKQKKDAKYRRGGKTSSPVLFEPIRTFSRVGHGVGQAVDPHFDPHIFQHFCNKKHRKPKFSMLFWSCWADSNCRPHPYQDWLVVVPLCSSPVFCCNSLSVFNALTIFRQISIVVCCSLLSAEKVLSSRFFSRFFKSLLFCVG